MKSFAWISLLLSHILYGQLCLIDAKDMFSVGSSEIVNGEKLTLFCCNDGHQMWLSNYPDENLINKIDNSIKETKLENQTVKLSDHKKLIFANYLSDIIEPKDVIQPGAVIMKETVLKKASKIQSNNNSYSNSMNIQKFGVETLLHKKIESDRIYKEGLDNEKTELLRMMLSQKKLFEEKKKKSSLYKFSILDSSVTFTYYTVAILIILSIL